MKIKLIILTLLLVSISPVQIHAKENNEILKSLAGSWGEGDKECLAHHRSNLPFIFKESGHFYFEAFGERDIEHWFLNPRIENEVIYLSSDLLRDKRPVLGTVKP